jgi:hypothetical protein
MSAVFELIVALSLLFGAGALSIKSIEKLEAMAKIKIQKGLPHLSPFTEKLTCIYYDNRTGEAKASHAKNCQK